MTKKNINQNFISLIEYYKMINLDIIFNNSPIVRLEKKENLNNIFGKKQKLYFLKKNIETIKNSSLKGNSSKIIFSDGNINSQIMIVGDLPQIEDLKTNLPFSGEAGNLLNKMLKAINLNRNNTYITNVVNFITNEKIKITDEEIIKFIPYLKLHIEIINPKILILLGSVALQALFGKDKSISDERGKWKSIKINHCTPKTICTFHPNFLIKQPEQKKSSWEDIKLIRKEIISLRLFKT